MKKQSPNPRIEQIQKQTAGSQAGRGPLVRKHAPGGAQTRTWDPLKKSREPAWAKVFLQNFLLRFISVRLNWTDVRVLAVLLGEMHYRNVVQTEHWVVADMIGIDRAHVTRAIARLVKADILQRVATADAPSKPFLRFNPMIFYRGNRKEWDTDRHATVIRGNFGKGKSADD